ncbi:MAG: helix-turn-helix domain-containing protein [Cytophagaceae bacterium]|jgi:transcriptional regulator with XRE-family HTH domain|nr:helix-turn-helix domain-containing protein [Cytophagaceae bacterium]
MKKIGDVLRQLRLQHNWSQEYMAFVLHMSLPGYSKIERNQSELCLSRLCQLAEIFQLKPSELLAFCEEKELPGISAPDHRDQEIIRLQQKIIALMEIRIDQQNSA